MTTTTIVRNNTKSKSALFLLELVIAITFLALSSVICIRLFVAAHTISRQTSYLNMAIVRSQTVAEVFKAAGGDPAKIEEILNPALGECGCGTYQLFYDENWQEVSSGTNAAYRTDFTLGFDGSMNTAEILVWNNRPDGAGNPGTQIYSLTAKSYVGQGVPR